MKRRNQPKINSIFGVNFKIRKINITFFWKKKRNQCMWVCIDYNFDLSFFSNFPNFRIPYVIFNGKFQIWFLLQFQITSYKDDHWKESSALLKMKMGFRTRLKNICFILSTMWYRDLWPNQQSPSSQKFYLRPIFILNIFERY